MKKRVEIASEVVAAQAVGNRVMAAVAQRGYSERNSFAIHLALEEGLINAIRHGNKCCADKRVIVEYEVTDQRVEIRITDEGQGFVPETVPDPTTDENLEKPSGRGIMLMRAYMDDVKYFKGGACVCMIKHNRP